MQFTIEREQLLNPLQQIVNVIERRQTMPILANVKLQLADGRLTFTGTDLEVQIIAHVPVTSEVSGSTTLPARKLLDICRLLPTQASIKFDLDGDKAKVSSGKGRYVLSSLPADDYPEFSEYAADCQFQVPSATLKKALDKTLFAMANQDVRYYLNGLLLHMSNSQIKLVASDGHRLALYEDQLVEPCGQEMRVIIPRKGVIELGRLLENDDSPVTVQLSSNAIRVQGASYVFSAKLIDAKYPDFNKVMQQNFLDPLVVDKLAFKEALTRVAILANEKFRGISLDISPERMLVSAHNPEHEEAEDELPVTYQGDTINIGFNVQYLLEAVGNLDTASARISVAANASCIFVDEAEPCNYRYVVMPIRL